MAKYIEFFKENASEDTNAILSICDEANRQLHDNFKMSFTDSKTNKPDPRLLAACFAKIYEAILVSLEKFEKAYSDFEINICDRLLIGYSTSQDDEDEKQGNFMVYLRDLGVIKKRVEFDDLSASAVERCVQWGAENITSQPEVIKKISTEAIQLLKEIDVEIASSECIMPIFVTTYEMIVNHLIENRGDRFEYEINMMGCFYIGVRESEDINGVIYIRPNIESKLRLKNDTLASSKYE
jgi:hypothetical protein